MTKIAAEIVLGNLTSYNYPATYDPDELGLGPLMVQKSGLGVDDDWAGPVPIARGRPVEQNGVGVGFPWAMQWSDTIDWVFFGDVSTAAATRRIVLYTHDRSNGDFLHRGHVTITPPSGTNHTIRGFRMTYDTYSTGTVEVSGTAVTGSGTAWQTARFAVGGRIGFGSTNPNLITTWYEITAIGSDTGITIGASAGTIGAGAAFVIEELRAVVATTASTAANGGLFVAKGLNFDIFHAAGTTIAAAVSTDNLRATYWLADAGTVTNTVMAGIPIETKTSNTVHYVWGLNGTTAMTLYKYNLRAALTLSSGKDTANAIQFITGAITVAGTVVQFNNGRVANTGHGPGAGQNCIYFVSGTRIYRTIPVNEIQTASTIWVADTRTEIPPGGSATFAAGSALLTIEYISFLDLFMIQSNSTTVKPYFSKYLVDASPLDRNAFARLDVLQSSSGHQGIPPVITLAAFSMWIEGGMMYYCANGTTATTNFIFVVPIGADWEYTYFTDSKLILPKINTPNCKSFSRVLTTAAEIIGQSTNENFGIQTEPIKISYRTVGIDDDSGTWTGLPANGNLSGITKSEEIQFSIEFRVLGTLGIPARIFSLAVLYEDNTTDVHYQQSVIHTNANLKQFAWRFSTAFGTAVPPLKVSIYDAISGNLLIEDNTNSPVGTFERSTNNGGTWSAWVSTDKTNETTYIRYTPIVLGDNLKIRVVLTLL